MQTTDKCIRCMKCCHYILDGMLKKCKHLDIPNKRCKIYHRRLGTRIDKGVYCTTRRLSMYDYKGCPYNDGKPMFPVEITINESKD